MLNPQYSYIFIININIFLKQISNKDISLHLRRDMVHGGQSQKQRNISKSTYPRTYNFVTEYGIKMGVWTLSAIKWQYQ